MSDLESGLRRRFAVRDEGFSHGAFAVDLLLPASADALIDESEFDADERLPYWAELWPSARALTRFLLDSPPPGGPAIELGCGVALPSLALRARGVEALATDYYPEALDFARANAERNAIPAPRTILLDWRDPPPGLGRFPLAVAADVLYESRNGEALAGFLPRVIAPGGSVLIADPGRAHAPAFEREMRERGWGIEEVAVRKEPPSRVRILRLRPPPFDQKR